MALSLPARGHTGVVKLCSPRTGREVRRVGSYNLTEARNTNSLTLTSNGDAVSPDGRAAYLVGLGDRGIGGAVMSVMRAPTDGGRASVIADGAQPSISSDGRLLAYGTGNSGKVLAVRDLATGRTRSISLARWIGHGDLTSPGQGNGSMTWLSSDTDLAVIPDEGVVWDLVGKPPHPPNNPCSDEQSYTTCVLVVHTGGASSRPLTVSRYELPDGFENLRTLGADQGHPHALLAASFPMVVERIDLNAQTATIERLVTIHGDALPDAFNPDGTELLYESGQPSEVRELRVPESATSSPTQTTFGTGCGVPVAW